MRYRPLKERYGNMQFKHCGSSGLELPLLSLGLWHNFGGIDAWENSREMLLEAFDNGITHFDLANNYGPPPGSAEDTLGRIINDELFRYRDELIISTKAGFGMWDGPYGDGGSKKYLISSLDQSLRRMKIDYVDIFYHHRFDPNTPLEETMHALELIYRQGKALYIGISNYNSDQTKKAIEILNSRGVPCLVNQFKYNMLFRDFEQDGLLHTLGTNGIGSIAYSPLAQGLLSDRYINGIPKNSRAAKPDGFLRSEELSESVITKIRNLNDVALNRNQSLAEMAIAWLWYKGVTSVLIGASSTKQLEANLGALKSAPFMDDEIAKIDEILNSHY